MLVERDQRTKDGRREQWEHDAVARTVALKHLALHERLAGTRSKLLADLLLGLTERERLGLREVVGEEDAVVEGVADGVLGGGGGEEIGGDELGALVHELVERVLAVRACCSPDDRL